ncbi:MAG: 3-deoxy-7-phosphoheptulonate synthase, partial [Gemmatimonadetes bacterium]|nr:3-deoxy-7-phosphoheptulonate synthase [Gemmatimonadota bacterium]
MIIIARTALPGPELDGIREFVERHGLRTHVSHGTDRTVIGCVGDARAIDPHAVRALPGVEEVIPVRKPYRLASREFVAGRTVIPLGDRRGTLIGGPQLVVAAGPCSVEGRAMLLETATAVRASGARMLRGGAFKPRTSPWVFQGLGVEALELLAEARAATGLPVVTEVMDPRQVELVAAHAD